MRRCGTESAIFFRAIDGARPQDYWLTWSTCERMDEIIADRVGVSNEHEIVIKLSRDEHHSFRLRFDADKLKRALDRNPMVPQGKIASTVEDGTRAHKFGHTFIAVRGEWKLLDD